MLTFILPLMLLNLVLCANPRSLAELITNKFINNLNLRDLGLNFPVYEEPSELPEQKLVDESKLSIYTLPDENLSQIFEYMCYEDCDKFLELSKACNFIAKKWILNRLTRFSPHFLFTNGRINQLVAFELSRYFRTKTRISDVDACDQYELACFNGITEYRGIIGYLVQSFIHESLYGSDSPIPTEFSQWTMMLFMKIVNNKTRKYDMCLTLFIQNNRKQIDENFDDPSDRLKLNTYLDLFVEFITSPSLTEEKLLEFEERKRLIELEPRHLQMKFAKQVQFIIKMLFHEILISQHELVVFTTEIFKEGLYSKSLFER